MPMPTSTQIERYKITPSLVLATLEGLDEAHIHYIPAQGEWSIHEIVIHLADSETMGYWRLRKTLAEERSTLPVYDEAAWAQKTLISYSGTRIGTCTLCKLAGIYHCTGTFASS